MRHVRRRGCRTATQAYQVLEQELGRPVVERSPGGKSGGIAQVSDTGHILMEKYERLEREVAEFTEKKFREIF